MFETDTAAKPELLFTNPDVKEPSLIAVVSTLSTLAAVDDTDPEASTCSDTYCRSQLTSATDPADTRRPDTETTASLTLTIEMSASLTPLPTVTTTVWTNATAWAASPKNSDAEIPANGVKHPIVTCVCSAVVGIDVGCPDGGLEGRGDG